MKKLSIGLMSTLLSIFFLRDCAQSQSAAGDQLMFRKSNFVKSASYLTDADKIALEDMK